jgi:hypothetical protein
MTRQLAHLTVRGNLLVLRPPYNPEFLADFKIVVPYAQRQWSPGTKTWQIEDCYLEECCKTALIDLCDRHFDRVIIFGEDTEPPALAQASDWAAAMFAAVPARLHQPLTARSQRSCTLTPAAILDP